MLKNTSQSLETGFKSIFAPLRLCVKLLTLAFLSGVLVIADGSFAQAPPVPNEGTLPPTSPADKSPAAPDEPTENAKPATATDELAVDQARLADRFKRLEEVLGRLAEISASSDPRRAKLLREAIAESREKDVNSRFESIVKLLQDERLSAASTNQVELQKELDSLLALLLKADRDKELASQRERIHAYMKELERLIRMERGIRARTDGGDALPNLGKEQGKIAEDTGKLGSNIEKTEGEKKNDGDSPKKGDGKPVQKPDRKQEPKPGDKQQPGDNKDKSGEPRADGNKEQSPKSQQGEGKKGSQSKSQSPKQGDAPPSEPQEGQPGSPSPNDGSQPKPNQPQAPADRATNRLQAAQKQMEDAIKKIEENLRKDASDRQTQALKNLEQAKAELERVLRQLREEEVERTLTQLAARFRKMLDMQTVVYDGTKRLDRVPQAQRTHDHEIESARLSRQETLIVREVDKALLVLHEEGSSVAFPEAIEQMRDDMRHVAERLAAFKVEIVTQGLEKDIIAQLEETIAALDKAIKDAEKRRTPRGQMPSAGQPEDRALVDKLSELKMIRSLQMRINKRTQLYGEMIKGEQAETPEILKALDDLADRQQRVYKATSDLQHDRNE
jgi:hypothetical protein